MISYSTLYDPVIIIMLVMVLLLLVLQDPLILFSYLIYYIILCVGYDVGIILYCIVGYGV